MKAVAKIILLGLIIFLNNNLHAYSMDDLLNELDTSHWREKISDLSFINQFKSPEKFSIVVSLTDARGVDWRYKIRAIKLLGNIGTPQAEEALLKMFQDHFFHNECPSLKSYVAEALGSFKPGKRLMEILKEGLNDGEVLVREATVRSLERLKMPDSVKYLKEAFMHEKSEAVKIAIIEALKTIGTTEALNFIKNLSLDNKK